MNIIKGNILFLDRNDINTDEIIPAKYLSEVSKEALKPHLLEDMKLEGFNNIKDINGKVAVIARQNFGCGSSREHAPWALEVNGIKIVIAAGFARIFRRNMFNCGMAAIELQEEKIEDIFNTFSGKDTEISANISDGKLTLLSGTTQKTYDFKLNEFDLALINAGGWVEYADSKY